MIFLFTDFGASGPYLGQMEAVIRQSAADVAVIDLVSNAPVADPVRSSYLLAALSRQLPDDSVFLCVVDPGVGGMRHPVVLRAGTQWFVGPDNGLFNTVALQAATIEWRIVDWRPERLSRSFHGRDLFAPIAARVACGDFDWACHPYPGPLLVNWPQNLAEIIYIDHYGNAVTGLRYQAADAGSWLVLEGMRIAEAGTFSDVPDGTPFWYCNSMELIEIAVNRGRADQVLPCRPGQRVSLERCRVE